MPTKEEQDELRENCKWLFTSQNAVYGYEVTGPNGNSIFLPAAGYMYEGTLDDAGSYGYYWSSSLDTDYPYNAFSVIFYSDNVGWSSYLYRNDGRFNGQSVRPVCE